MTDLSLAGIHHLKFPVANIDAALEWFQTVLKARWEPRFDHIDTDGTRFAVQIFYPGVDIPCELRLAPKAALAVNGYDPVTFGVADDQALQEWINHFDAVGAEHTGAVPGFIGKVVAVTSPEGLVIRLYTKPVGGFANVEFKPEGADIDNASLITPLMARS